MFTAPPHVASLPASGGERHDNTREKGAKGHDQSTVDEKAQGVAEYETDRTEGNGQGGEPEHDGHRASEEAEEDKPLRRDDLGELVLPPLLEELRSFRGRQPLVRRLLEGEGCGVRGEGQGSGVKIWGLGFASNTAAPRGSSSSSVLVAKALARLISADDRFRRASMLTRATSWLMRRTAS